MPGRTTRTTTTTRADALARRCGEAAWATLGAHAEQTGEWSCGTWVLTPRLDRVWDHNLLRVERLPRVNAVRRVLAGADEVLGGAGLAHRRLVCHDAALGERLADPLVQRGWRAESLAVMAWPEDRPVPVPAPNDGRELGDREARALHERLTREAYATDPAVAAQLAATLPWCAPVGAPADAPAALARVWRAAELAEIDDVGVLPGARGQGLGTRVVLVALAAARTAGARCVFLRADERDWPWTWYARLGFGVVGRHWSFVRPGA